MPNTCTICKHPDGEQIESALARGQSLHNLA
jgi:putative hemolysin